MVNCCWTCGRCLSGRRTIWWRHYGEPFHRAQKTPFADTFATVGKNHMSANYQPHHRDLQSSAASGRLHRLRCTVPIGLVAVFCVVASWGCLSRAIEPEKPLET